MFILSISENILIFVSGFGTIQGILLALLIYFYHDSDRSVNRFMALYIFSLSVLATTPFIQFIISWQKSFFMEPFAFLPGPLLYLYVRSFRESVTWRKASLHIMPFFISFFVFYWFFEYMAGKFPNEKEVPADALRDPRALVLGWIRILQNLCYYFLSRRALVHYQRSIRHLFSDTTHIDLNWIKWLLNGYLIFVLASMVIYTLILKYPWYFNLLLLLDGGLLAPYIYIATFKGIGQRMLWQVQPRMSKQEVEEEMNDAEEMEIAGPYEQKPKYQKTVLDETRMNMIMKKMIVILEQERLYQEAELTLQDLAEKLQIPPHQVSQAINEGMNKNFYDLINGYRVGEAKRLLLDPKSRNYTILSIGFEAGFNSKTTFNTVFKKFTGVTPTYFRDHQHSLISQPLTSNVNRQI